MDMGLVHRSQEGWKTVQEAEIECDVGIGQIGHEVRIECDAEIVGDHENSCADLCSMHDEVDAVGRRILMIWIRLEVRRILIIMRLLRRVGRRLLLV